MWDAKSAELLVGEICEGVTGFPFVDTACFYDGGASRMGAGGGVGREEVMEQDTISTNLVIKDEICSLAAFSQAFWIRQPNEQHQLPFEFLHMKRGISTSAKLAVAHTLFKSVMDRRLPISIWRSEILNGMLMADSVWLDLLLLFLNSPHMFSLFGGGAGESAELEQEGEDRKTKRRERLAQLVNILVEIFSRVLKNGKKTMSDGEMGPIESSIFEICSNSIKVKQSSYDDILFSSNSLFFYLFQDLACHFNLKDFCVT